MNKLIKDVKNFFIYSNWKAKLPKTPFEYNAITTNLVKSVIAISVAGFVMLGFYVLFN